MNTKLVKSLRAKVGYHPSEPKTWVKKSNSVQLYVNPKTKRAEYRKLKKEMR